MNTNSIVNMNGQLIEKARLIAKTLTDDAAAIDMALQKVTLFDVAFNGEIRDTNVTVDISEPIRTSIEIPHSDIVAALGGVSEARQELLGWIKKYAQIVRFANDCDDSELEYRNLTYMVGEVKKHIVWDANKTEDIITWLINGHESKYATSCLVGSSVKCSMMNLRIENLSIPAEIVFRHFDAEIKRREDDLIKHIARYEFLCSPAAANGHSNGTH